MKYIIEMPDELSTEHWCHLCQDKQNCPKDCSGHILSNAVKAVEVAKEDVGYGMNGLENHYGKPVSLFAVEVEK